MKFIAIILQLYDFYKYIEINRLLKLKEATRNLREMKGYDGKSGQIQDKEASQSDFGEYNRGKATHCYRGQEWLQIVAERTKGPGQPIQSLVLSIQEQ
jgi:hypothetical protein